jgi:hypothetical protein
MTKWMSLTMRWTKLMTKWDKENLKDHECVCIIPLSFL